MLQSCNLKCISFALEFSVKIEFILYFIAFIWFYNKYYYKMMQRITYWGINMLLTLKEFRSHQNKTLATDQLLKYSQVNSILKLCHFKAPKVNSYVCQRHLKKGEKKRFLSAIIKLLGWKLRVFVSLYT